MSSACGNTVDTPTNTPDEDNAQASADTPGATDTPAKPYTGDDLNYNNSSGRVSREHDNEPLRKVELSAAEVKSWDTYDTVFIGYPIW